MRGILLAAVCVLAWPALGAARQFELGGIVDFSTLVVSHEPLRPTSDAPLVLRTTNWETIGPLLVIPDCLAGYYWGEEALVQDRRIVITASSGECPSGSGAVDLDSRPQHRVTRAWTVGPLAPGLYSVEVGGEEWTRFEVVPPSPVLALRDGRFRVTVETAFEAATPRATAVTLESGFYSFFAPSNVELTVKILDGRGLNGHFWLFVASMTDLPLRVTVVDTAGGCDPASTCPLRVYEAEGGKNQNFIDTEAFLE